MVRPKAKQVNLQYVQAKVPAWGYVVRTFIRYIPYIGLIFCLLAGNSRLSAIEVDGLYEAEMSVTSQGRAERSKVIRAALAEVIIKVSGNSQVSLSPGIPEILKRSKQYLQQYRYSTVDLPPDPETGIVGSEQLLWVRFDQVALDKSLRDIAVPIWGHTRPVTLVWMASDQQGARQLLGSSDFAMLTDTFLKQAKRRGIPIALPLFDLEDQQRVAVSDVIAGFKEPVMEASIRYPADAVMFGRIREVAPERWEGRWTLNTAGKEYSWSQQGDLVTVIDFAVDGMAVNLAASYARASGNDSGQLKVLVTGITSLDDYARSDRYLAGLDGVVDVQAAQVERDRILFNVQLQRDLQNLIQAVRLSSQQVLSVDVQPATSTPTQTLPGQVLPDNTGPDISFRLLR